VLAIAVIAIAAITKTQISSLFNGDHFHYRCALKRFEVRWSTSTRFEAHWSASYRWLSLATQRNAQP